MLFSIFISFCVIVRSCTDYLGKIEYYQGEKKETISCGSNPCDVEQHYGSTISIAFKFEKLYIVVLIFFTSICHHCIKTGSDDLVSLCSRPISS